MPKQTPAQSEHGPVPGVDLQDIFDNAPIGIFTSTPEGTFLSVNHALARMYGYDSPQDLIDSVSDTATQVYADPAAREEFMRLMEEHGEVINHECRFRRRDGSEFWVSRNVRAVKDQEGRIVAYQGFSAEITDRKQADQELREKTQRLNSITENMFDMVSITDLEGNYRYLGPSHAILGYDLDVMIGKNVMEHVHPDDYQAVATAFAVFLANREDGRKVEYRYRRADGSYLWFETVGKFILDEQGKPEEILFSTRDFTARKQAEEALIESEALFRGMFNDHNAVMLLIDPTTGQIVKANHAAAQYYGYPLEAMIQMNIKQLNVLSPAEIADKKGSAFNRQVNVFDFRHMLADGQVRDVEVHSAPITIMNQILLFSIIQDITERKRAELALSKSRKLMAQAEKMADLGSWEWNIKNDTWLMSDNWKRINGVPDIQLTTPQLLPIAHPEDRPAIEEAFAKATENGEPYNIEHRIIRQDTGEVRYVHARGLVEMDGNGKPGAMIGTVQDITKLKQTQNLLVESEARFRSLFENSPIAYQSLNEEGFFIDVNDRLSELLGYERSEILGKNFGELWSKRTRHIYPEIFEGFKYSGCVKGELELIHKGGSALFVLLEGRTQRDPEGKFIRTHCILSDITERKRAEEKIRVINEQLQKANAEKDQLFTIIAHDLKSPMSGLVESTQMLAIEPELFSEQDFRFLAKEMHKNAVNTFELLEDLLQWSRMSQGGIDYAPTSSSLNDLITMGFSTGQDMARAKNIAIRKDFPQGLTVLVDQPMVKTVIRNILFNAIKFTHRGGEIVIRARQEGQTVTVAIQDNGIGMSEQIMSTAFFLEKDNRQLGTEGEKGTGLGLVLCKQFIEQHGGQIWVESETGKGTTVFFTLPVSD